MFISGHHSTLIWSPFSLKKEYLVFVWHQKWFRSPSACPWFCCCSVAQSCLTLCNSMDCSTPGFPVLNHFPEFAQTHIHWCHPTISSAGALFFFCLHSFPASGSFPVSWLFASDGQSTEASVSASVLPMNIQGWYCSIITFSELIYLITGSLYLLTTFTHFVHPSTAPLTLITINLFSELLFICF